MRRLITEDINDVVLLTCLLHMCNVSKGKEGLIRSLRRFEQFQWLLILQRPRLSVRRQKYNKLVSRLKGTEEPGREQVIGE